MVRQPRRGDVLALPPATHSNPNWAAPLQPHRHYHNRPIPRHCRCSNADGTLSAQSTTVACTVQSVFRSALSSGEWCVFEFLATATRETFTWRCHSQHASSLPPYQLNPNHRAATRDTATQATPTATRYTTTPQQPYDIPSSLFFYHDTLDSTEHTLIIHHSHRRPHTLYSTMWPVQQQQAQESAGGRQSLCIDN